VVISKKDYSLFFKNSIKAAGSSFYEPHRHIGTHSFGFLCDLCAYVVISKKDYSLFFKNSIKAAGSSFYEPHRHIGTHSFGFLCDLCAYVDGVVAIA